MTHNTTRLDHVVLWVRDPVAAARFYEKTLGLEPLRVTEYTAGTVSFPSVRLNDETILDLAPHSWRNACEWSRCRRQCGPSRQPHLPVAVTARLEALRARLEEQAITVSDLAYDSTAPEARPGAASTSATRTATSSRLGTTIAPPGPGRPTSQNSGSGSTPSSASNCRLGAHAAPKPPMPPSPRRPGAARHDDRQRIGPHRHAHRLCGARPADPVGEVAVPDDRAVGDAGRQLAQYLPVEARDQRPVQRRVEVTPPPAKYASTCRIAWTAAASRAPRRAPCPAGPRALRGAVARGVSGVEHDVHQAVAGGGQQRRTDVGADYGPHDLPSVLAHGCPCANGTAGH